jgi:DNA-binding NarL/FixJ family response regulator
VAPSVRVVLVDDHDFFRDGLRELLTEHGGVEILGEGADGAEAIELVSRHRPDVVIMDLNMPRMSGVEATRLLTADPSGAETRVLMLTISADDSAVIDAIRAGASGYILKDAPIEEIFRAIEAVASGQLLVSPRVARALVGAVGESADRSQLAETIISALSKRELEVLRLVAEGRGNAEIAKELFLSPATVKNHVAKLLNKLGVENRVEAAACAVRARLV